MKGLVIFSLCLAALLLPMPALASCVYNKAHTPIHVSFTCDACLGRNWTIHPTYHRCRPGKAGTVTIRVMDAQDKNEINDGYCTVYVGKHGWVTVCQKGDTVTVKSKKIDSTVGQECTLRIVRSPK